MAWVRGHKDNIHKIRNLAEIIKPLNHHAAATRNTAGAVWEKDFGSVLMEKTVLPENEEKPLAYNTWVFCCIVRNFVYNIMLLG